MLRLDAVPEPVALLLGQIGPHEAYPQLVWGQVLHRNILPDPARF